MNDIKNKITFKINKNIIIKYLKEQIPLIYFIYFIFKTFFINLIKYIKKTK